MTERTVWNIGPNLLYEICSLGALITHLNHRIKLSLLMSAEYTTAQIIQLPQANRQRNIQVVRQVKGAVDNRMNYLFDGLLLNVADALFEEMHGMDQHRQIDEHFNITRALKVRGDVYQEEFLTLMNLSWVNLIKSKNYQALPDAPCEVAPTLTYYSERNLNHYKILLEEIRLRFTALVDTNVDFHPLLPNNFYLCFWHATEKLGINYSERVLLLPLFNRFAMDRFGQVLSIANQGLVEFGIKIHELS
ncbi:MAG: DUF1631 family protein [Pseudomonadales bacterium]|nr:DUF1631 family protein [Pseudomonadales bacterium]